MTFDLVSRPEHYNSHPSGVECVWLTMHMTFCAGNAFKYVWRTDLKNGRQDLEKGLQYADMVVEHELGIWVTDHAYWLENLERVIAFETDFTRISFFTAARFRNRLGMRESIKAILAKQT